MRGVLKPAGSSFLHCDDHANSYIQADILDKLFIRNNFRSHITWKRSSAHNDAKQGRKALGNIADTIFYYTKSDEYISNQQYTEYSEKYISEFYKYTD